MTEQLVSIVIAAYNASEHLPRTLKSMLSQTYSNIEVVVVDDGSTDDTAQVVAKASESDRRVRLVSMESNVGRSKARNAGIDAARGEWVAINDADDLWHPQRVEKLIDAAHSFPESSVFTDDLMSYSLGPDGEVELGHRHVSRSTILMGEPHEISRRGWFMDNSCHMRPMIKRDYLNRVGVRYPTELSAGEDNNFYMKLAFHPDEARTVRVPEPMYYYVEGTSTRQTSMANNRVWSMKDVIAFTGNRDLEKWSKRCDPGRLWVLHRSDMAFEESGRASGEPTVADGETLPPLNPLRGYATLIWWKVLAVASKAVDSKVRGSVATEISRQLAS